LGIENDKGKSYDAVLPTNNDLGYSYILELVLGIKERFPNIRIVVSGYYEPDFVNRLTEYGIDGFIRMPFKVEELIRDLQEVIGLSVDTASARRVTMNKKQQLVLFVSAAVIVGMLLYPPFHFQAAEAIVNVGYSFLLKPPMGKTTVNVTMLLVQWIGVIFVGALLWFAFQDRK
jgi:hypothetical protein